MDIEQFWKESAKANREALEAHMLQHITAHGLNEGVQRQHRFCDRKWAFDFAWPARKIALEVDGGTWTGGRHTRGAGYERDCEKMNTALTMGWRVLRVTSGQVKSGAAVNWLMDLLGRP